MSNQTDSSFVPEVAIEGIQSVTPMKITDPRQTREVVSAGEVVGPGIFQRCLNMVYYYKKEKEEDSGWLVAGWIKETLGRALLEQPLICGRLRKKERDGGELEIVSNDSGIRMIEARIQMNLSEFLELKQREEAEPQLVSWKDIDERNPQFSPLFYVQVTNFQCGGYSIGISCSILLADLLLRTEFLKTWANIHNNIINNNNGRKLPLFYLPGLKNITASSPNIIGSNSSKNSGKTLIFKINAETDQSLGSEWFREVGLACLEEAEKNLGSEMGADFSLFVNESLEPIKVESCSKHGVLKPQLKLNKESIITAKWDELVGTNEVTFRQGNKPAHVSYWFRSILGGIVFIIPSTEEKTCKVMNIIVAIPNVKS
ncbi:Transferase [Corchorus olitorius]|uniref:Transferase n=1 Tax=Corchorus olitorius TaxID=93759 RepID=A0A1R3IRQ6_9ROSI|nr:Transferase [Corchorus olitorius]